MRAGALVAVIEEILEPEQVGWSFMHA